MIDPFEAGKLYVKISSACLKQENALGIYTSGTVFAPEMYCAVAEDMKEEEETYPILDWIYFGLYQTEKGMNGYTYGMTAFGKDEIDHVCRGRTRTSVRKGLHHGEHLEGGNHGENDDHEGNRF